uniref:C-type lectin domain-containing protein n=1 Tax=Podarcis muralis TaxID=64176 RepID=A0A670IRG8_PODMU
MKASSESETSVLCFCQKKIHHNISTMGAILTPYCHLCPTQWRLHNNKCYWFSETIQSWEKSKEDCIAKKSHLLIIDNQEEKEFIQKNGKSVWIGLIVSSPKKKWIWINGSLLQEKLFPAMQPEEGSCGVLYDDEIYSELCSTQLHWICQKGSVLL